MSEDRKKPGWTIWATVGLVVALVGYPLSFGPACGFVARKYLSARFVEDAYWPILWGYVDTPFGIVGSISSYAEIWLPPGSRITLEHKSTDGHQISCPFWGR